MIKNRDHINGEIYDISIQKLVQFLLSFKENLITTLGSDEGIKIYDQWFTGTGFLELLKPYYQEMTNNSLGHKSKKISP
jgi:hypothetical protein